MEIEMKRYILALKKRFWIIALIVGAACSSAFFYTKAMDPNYYIATNKLIVNKTVQVLGGEQMDQNSIGTSIRLIETYKEIILTPAIMDKVVERYPDLGLTTRQLISMIRVNSLNETQVMTLSATDTEYVRAARAVNAVSAAFQSEIPKIMKVDNVTILTKANEDQPTRPFGQNLKSNFTIALLISLMLSSGLIVLLEVLDNTIKTEEDVMQLLGVPSFASIPKVRKRDFRSKSRHSSGSHSKNAAKSSIKAGEQSL